MDTKPPSTLSVGGLVRLGDDDRVHEHPRIPHVSIYYPGRVTDVQAGLAVISVVADLALSACDRRADLVEATRSSISMTHTSHLAHMEMEDNNAKPC